MDVTTIVVSLIGLIFMVLGTVITKSVVPWIRASTSETTQAIIESAAEMAVLTAQQLYADYSSTAKKCSAMSYMKTLLNEYNLTIDETVMSNAIESALKALKIEAGDSWSKTESETDETPAD